MKSGRVSSGRLASCRPRSRPSWAEFQAPSSTTLERAVGLGRERVLHALDAQDEAVQRGFADDCDASGTAGL